MHNTKNLCKSKHNIYKGLQNTIYIVLNKHYFLSVLTLIK